MRDVLKIVVAGSVLTAYAVLVPSMVEAVPAPAGKAFTQRLPQAGGAVPVSARLSASDTVETRVFVARRPLVSGVSTSGAAW
ncbi:hypothetical protein [Methylobacterium sp. Leaf118]|uniref:hypothetical protein n=1 Tax=Methylobacterium sp. Leaf118 TaxID=2876562 RepID=UPI001E345CB3|nr:hypothetical protein [Methylobacterium sp. Leaf118]